MLFGNRGPRPSAARRREEFQPRMQPLEERCLLAVIDLGGVLPPLQPNIATAPFGVDLATAQAGNLSGAAGLSVNDVGDVNGDGFQDFVIGAPTGVFQSNAIVPSTGGNSRVYLVFGSTTVSATNVLQTLDWLTLNNTNGQRVGDLGQLGNVIQTNPISQAGTGNAFAGITFLNGSVANNQAQLGASVGRVGDINGDGFADFLIGAPGAAAISGNTGTANTGRAYLVYGGPFTGITSNIVDLDNPNANAGVNVVTFASTIPNGRLGASVAGVGGVLATGSAASDIVMGAPNASLAGQTLNGAVYLFPGTGFTAAGTTTINVVTAGQAGAAVTFAGSAPGQQIGQSVAGAGNVNGDTTINARAIDDLLIGAPNASGGSGAAYLVYGEVGGLARFATNVGGTSVITVDRIGSTATNGIVGATFTGIAGWSTGFAVSTIGDWNGDGLADIAIGSPRAQGNAGRVTVFYGQPGVFPTTTTPATSTLIGTIPLNNIPPTVLPFTVTLIGANPGDLAGYSLSVSGKVIAGETGNDFLIGAPGFNSSQGVVYFVPANPFPLPPTISLSNAQGPALSATLIQLTNTPGNAPFLGASVSGLLTSRGQTRTADGDGLADFIIGAPGYGVISTSQPLFGGAFVIEGKFLPVTPPSNTAIQTTIGVDQAPPATAPPPPYTIGATSPTAMRIFVLSNLTTTPPFNPFTDIDPTTVVVNGVAFPMATKTLDPIDENGDMIPDAIITISPRSLLNLLPGPGTLTITGRTLPASASAGNPFFGTTTIIVPTIPPPPTGLAALPVGTIIPNFFLPQFGPDVFVPSPTELSKMNYKPIPLAVAYQQYLPKRGFAIRLRNFAHPETLTRIEPSRKHSLAGTGHLVNTLDNHAHEHSHVFTRSKYHGNKRVEFKHQFPVIPTNRNVEKFVGSRIRKPGQHPTGN